MPENLQLVKLEGGSFDGQLAYAPPPFGALRLGASFEGKQWSELYLYANGQIAEDPVHGTVSSCGFRSCATKFKKGTGPNAALSCTFPLSMVGGLAGGTPLRHQQSRT